MQTTNLQTSTLLPLIENAKSDFINNAEDLKRIVDDFLNDCDEKGLQIAAPVEWRRAAQISGGLHRFRIPSEQPQILLMGPTNCGKDTLTIQLLNKHVASALGIVKLPDGSRVNVLEEEDAPDKTRAIIRVEFGDDGDGLVIFNTPGLDGDNPILGEMTRAVVGLESSVAEIGYIDSARSPVEYEARKVEDIPFDLDKDLIVYMVNLAMVPLGSRYAAEIKADLQAISESVGDRLIVVGSFLDQIQKWQPELQERRRATWSEIVENDIRMVEYSGRTGEGLNNVIHLFLRALNRDPSSLLPFLRAERKASRLSYSLYSLSSLLSSLCELNQNFPYTDPIAAIAVTGAIHFSVHYSVSEEVWFAKNGDISRIIKDGIDKETRSRERDPKGFWEKLGRWWSNKRFYESVRVYQISVTGLSEVCELMYALIYELEGLSSSESAMVEASRHWFAPELKKAGVAAALETKDTDKLQRALSDVILKFWRVHHPNALDLESRLNL